jgi:hypothetical protein
MDEIDTKPLPKIDFEVTLNELERRLIVRALLRRIESNEIGLGERRQIAELIGKLSRSR